ncbi:hypothetical protein Goari_004066 [Gossypium aridum]|uniref:C2 domain-containing protein n=1 Tax=Gossypium aridum TaxID=34290 RepID=A0A7J8Y2B2_GOSAI|nr:hypothetical protein [Gossypium aridum]
MDFTLKVIGGDISTIPGLSDAIERGVDHIEQVLREVLVVKQEDCSGGLESTIRDAIEDNIMWPVRKIIPILPGDYSDLELKPVGILEVKLVQARDLTNKDIIGKSDPYANNELNPIWNEHYEFVIEDATTQHLVVRIYDDEGVQASELIGCAEVLLRDLEPGKVKDVWLNLVKDLEIQRDTKYRGQVHLELLYCPFGMENGFTNPFSSNFSMTSLEKVIKSGANGIDAIENEKAVTQKKKEVIVRGVLSVTVISAEDLPIVDLMGKADPYVVLTMKKSEAKHKTRVVNDSLNPVWNQTFDFVVEDGLHDMLILEVWDHDTFGKDYMGRCILTLTRVILEGEYKDTLQREGARACKLGSRLKYAKAATLFQFMGLAMFSILDTVSHRSQKSSSTQIELGKYYTIKIIAIVLHEKRGICPKAIA